MTIASIADVAARRAADAMPLGVSSEVAPVDRPTSRFHRIRTLEIDGGFLGGCSFDFQDDLNCLIGGRGTGKTTVLEVLRWVLDQPSTQPGRARDVEKLIRSNLGDAVARAKIETSEGIVYFVERAVGEDPQIFDAKGEPAPFSLRNGTVFAADAYSQNEIEEIAD